jgi:hypothetical protein
MRRALPFAAVVALLLSPAADAQVLFGFGDNNAVVAVDPATGVQTPVGSFGAIAATSTSTADPGGRRLFFIGNTGDGPLLVTFSATAGSVSQMPLAVSTPILEFDPLSGLLFGHDGLSSIVSIDPDGGAVTPVVHLAVDAVEDGVSTFDAARRRLIFEASVSGSPTLVVVPLAGGAVIEIPVTEYASSIEVDPVSGDVILFGAPFLKRLTLPGGSITTIASVAVDGSSQGISTFDASRRRAYFGGVVGSHPVLLVYDFAAGAHSVVTMNGVFAWIESLPSAASVPAQSTVSLLLCFVTIAAIALRRLSA